MCGQTLLFIVTALLYLAFFCSLFPHFNSHFPGGPGLAGTRMTVVDYLELRVMEVVVTTGAVRRAKLQSYRHHQQTNVQLFYSPDALLPSLRFNGHFPGEPGLAVYWSKG